MISKARIVHSFGALAVAFQLGCSSLTREVSSGEKSELIKIVRANTQCIIDSKVAYLFNDVPDWEKKPVGFCDIPNGKAVPIATSIFPVKGSSDSGKKMDDRGVFFYVIWGCYSTCDQLFLNEGNNGK